MSVAQYDRHEGRLEVLEHSRRLLDYTLTIINNEKNFPKRDRWILTKPIIDETMNLVTSIRKANSVLVQSDVDYNCRRRFQVDAFASLSALLTLIDAAYRHMHLDSKKIEHWTGLCVETGNKLKAWMKADRERYSNKA